MIEWLVSKGGSTLVGDESFVYFRRNGKTVGIVSLHVDDIQGAGNDEFMKTVMDELEKDFKISNRETNSFKYTGVDVCRKENGDICISQEDYKDSLKEIEIDPSSDNQKKLNRAEFKEFRGAVGKLH